MNKVYCKNCKWLSYVDIDYSGSYCRKPLGKKDSAMTEYEEIVDDYEKCNKKNNCKHYQRSWWKFWIKVEKKINNPSLNQ